MESVENLTRQLKISLARAFFYARLTDRQTSIIFRTWLLLESKDCQIVKIKR